MKYEDILFYIKREMLEGNIKPGGKLPSIRNICKKFKCSKVTAVKAYDLLEKENCIYSLPKSGHYLIENSLNINNNINENSIDFSTVAPDERILPYEEFQHCLSKALELYKKNLFSSEYSRGLENLIKVIAKQLQNYQVFANKQNIFIASGTQQAINILTMMPFPNGKKNVLLEQPTYHGIIMSLEINKVKSIGIPRNSNGIDFNELEKLFKDGDIKFFYTIPRFHNPTGFSYSNNDKKQILKLAEKYNVYIVEDDYLADLELDSKADPIYSFDSTSRVIYLKSYSKVLLPGLRVAAVVLPELLIQGFERYKRWCDINTGIISQGALKVYINSGMYNVHMKNLRKIYSERMAYLNKLTENIDNLNIKWHVPISGFFANLEIKNTVRSENVIRRLRQNHVLVEESGPFFLNSFGCDKLIRVSVSRTNNTEIKKGVSIILNELNSLK